MAIRDIAKAGALTWLLGGGFLMFLLIMLFMYGC
jgi:hypothetical protein